jgi:hypothetical protein
MGITCCSSEAFGHCFGHCNMGKRKTASKRSRYIRTVSGNWFEHFERFVQQILYVRSFVVAGLQGNGRLGA